MATGHSIYWENENALELNSDNSCLFSEYAKKHSSEHRKQLKIN